MPESVVKHTGPFELEFLLAGTSGLGLGAIRCGATLLRSSTIPAWPALESTVGQAFPHWRLSGFSESGGELRVAAEARGHLLTVLPRRNVYGDAWVSTLSETHASQPLASLELRFRADTYLGLPRLRMRTVVASEECEFDWVLERFTWEPGGTTEGATYFAQRWGSEYGGWEHSLDAGEFFSTQDAMAVNGQTVLLGQGQPRGGGGPALDFIYSPQRALALFREPLTCVRGLLEKRAGQTVLDVADQCWSRRSGRHETPWLSVVVYEAPKALTYEDAHGLWTRLWEEYCGRLSAATGIARPRPRPAIFFECWNLGSGRFFEHQQAQLTAVAATGAKRLLLHVLPHPHQGNNCCGLYDFTLLPSEGGLAALRRYTDAAHVLGLEVFAWSSGHFHRESPLVKSHPEWFVRQVDGAVFGGGYDCLAAFDFAHPALQEHYVRSLTEWRREGGVDGVWLDSLINLHFHGINFRRAAELGGVGPHVEGLLKCLRRLSEAGLQILTEGVSPLGLSAGNIRPPDPDDPAWTSNMGFHKLNCGPHALYRTSLWVRGPGQEGGRRLGQDLYFRTLANGAVLALFHDTTDSRTKRLGDPEVPPPAIAEYARMNSSFLQVQEEMQVRELLPGDAGVLWHPALAAPQDLSSGVLQASAADAPGPRVFFAFQDGKVLLAGRGLEGWRAAEVGGAQVQRVTADGLLEVHRFRVYRLTAN